MTTAYSSSEIARMEELFEKRLPRVPSEKDKRRLPVADAISAAGSPYGLWVRLHLEAQQFILLFLNPVVTMVLFQGINQSGLDAGWWKEEVGFVGNDMPAPNASAADGANEVISLTTASAGDLVLIHFARRGGSKQMVGLPKQIAIDLFLTIKQAGEQFSLWDKDFNFLPAESSQRITDEEIWRAANQLIQRQQGAAQTEATSRSQAAYAVGDMFNFDMWERVAQAVVKLNQTKPEGPNAIN